MPDYSKIFTYETDGLSYTVSLYEQDGAFLADIAVLDGAMDVNAVYFGDDDASGNSASLAGPLNMNGAQQGGQKVKWDDAVQLSAPGLGADGADKETYLSEGDTLTLELNIDSLDEIDVFGVRATSTTTPEGSIKGVSDDPEEPEDDEEPTFEKVGFGTQLSPEGGISDGIFISDEDLPEDEEATFENYLSYYENEVPDYDIPSIEAVVFYEFDAEDNPVELFRIEAPDGGFLDSEEVLDAYDAAIEGGALEAEDMSGIDLLAALSLEADEGEVVAPETVEDDSSSEDDLLMA